MLFVFKYAHVWYKSITDDYLIFDSLLQNFVGLSVSDGYIATGSETNEVLHLSYWLLIR
jgi:hypothetical protein